MMISTKATRYLIVSFFSGIPAGYSHEPQAQLPFEHPQALGTVEGHAHLGWESRYFSEGRDALDGDSLFAGSFEMGWQHLAGGVWYGYSPDQSYDELQITLALTHSIGDFSFYGGYTHLRFPFDDVHDNEVGAGVEWSGLPMEFKVAADAYYSFDATGLFAEISLAREIPITDQLAANLSGVFGVNQGYVSDGHDGANHFALRLGLEYAVSDSVSIIAQTAYSWGLERDRSLPGDDLLTDFFYGGLGLQWSF